MTHETLAPTVAVTASTIVAGLILGLMYFACLRRTVALFTVGGGWAGPASLTLARVVAATAVLGFAARFGAMSLMAAFLGFLVARTIVLHRARRVF